MTHNAFFQRNDTFALGVCNGCQMMSNLHEIIPGTQHWPHFARNQSEQFEARFVMVEVQPSPSIFFNGMAGMPPEDPPEPAKNSMKNPAEAGFLDAITSSFAPRAENYV